MNDKKCEVGIIGMAVMGKNLALNMADHGFCVTVWNRDTKKSEIAVKESGGRLKQGSTLEDFISCLSMPRRIIMMIQAGQAVDQVLEQLVPLLSPGDVVVDGGNSWFKDTQRREKVFSSQGLHFMGIGISGGEEGARHGPSLMPGGSKDGYLALSGILESISAKTEAGPCVTHVGPDGAGHFVKMVHNGIEYADMQMIAEAYDLMRHAIKLSPHEMADIFSRWDKGPLESFLIKITAKVLSVKDTQSSEYLVDKVLDKAGQKGTGQWTVQSALELGVCVPAIAAALDARNLSSLKSQRVHASVILKGPDIKEESRNNNQLLTDIHDALLASRIVAYAQGLSLIETASKHYNWDIDIKEIARIWKGGCIIRSSLLDTIREAYNRNTGIFNLMLDENVCEKLHNAQKGWRRAVSLALSLGVPVPVMTASLGYYDSYRSANLPQNLTQAQRDAFGAHLYQRTDDPKGDFIHTEWLI